jgi:hypothetical protein
MPSNSIRGISIPDPQRLDADRITAVKRSLRRKFDELPSEASEWATTLTIDCDEEDFVRLLEAFVFVMNSSRAEGSTSVPVARADLGDAIGVTPTAAGAILQRLESLGMVERRVRLAGQIDSYRPCSPSGVAAQRLRANQQPAMEIRRSPAPIKDKRLIAGLFGLRTT